MECAFCAENEFRVQAKRKTCDRREGVVCFLLPSSRGSGRLARRTLCACDPKSALFATFDF